MTTSNNWANQKSHVELLRADRIWSAVYNNLPKTVKDTFTNIEWDGRYEEARKEYNEKKKSCLETMQPTKQQLKEIEKEVKEMEDFFKSVRENELFVKLQETLEALEKDSTFMKHQRYGLTRRHDFCNLAHGMYNMVLFLNRFMRLFTTYDKWLGANYPLEKLAYAVNDFYSALGYYAEIKKTPL
jgi:hypothetical protein